MNPYTNFLRFIVGLSIALLISMCCLHQARADVSRSVFDGAWRITFVDGAGKTTVYENCRVTELDDVFITFTANGRSQDIKLPVTSGVSYTIMERMR